ncbi:MAG: radical SAM family heme chaperone HemW [Chloroflexi bacterium]|nr:radical SAM family heme chaperone HemW [Chloroflexota bacterium]
MRTAGLYIHIPFCRSKCFYCDFCSYAGMEELHADYVQALLAEAANESGSWGETLFDTVYIGGGTPTQLALDLLLNLWESLPTRLPIAAEAEVTIEANPGTVGRTTLSVLRSAGVNRLSLGVQSLNEQELRLLGRVHTVDEARAAIEAARQAGFDNLNLDLIFGLPGQSLAEWHRSLEQALALAPEHLSLYALLIEEGTPLAEHIAQGRLSPPDDDLAADMYELAQDLLEAAGYRHYEISNWARSSSDDRGHRAPALACQHNLKYWRNEPYLGLGVAAHSYDGQHRCANLQEPRLYIERIARGLSVRASCLHLMEEDRLAETMMLGLRLIEGIDRNEFAYRFGHELEELYGPTIRKLGGQGLLEVDEVGIRLTRRGRLLGNRVFAEFLP